MLCPNCSHEIDNDSKFCVYCGNPVIPAQTDIRQQRYPWGEENQQRGSQQAGYQQRGPQQAEYWQEGMQREYRQRGPQQAGYQQGYGDQQEGSQMLDKASVAARGFFAKVKRILRHPVEELNHIARSGDTSTGLYMILCNIIALMLMVMIAGVIINSRISSTMGYYGSSMRIPILRCMLTTAIVSAIISFGTAGLLHVFSKAFARNQQILFSQSLTAVGAKAFYDIFVLLAGIIFMIISIPLGMFLLSVGGVFTFILMITVYVYSTDLEGSAKVYVLTITEACLLLIIVFMSYVVASSAIQSTSSGIISLLEEMF